MLRKLTSKLGVSTNSETDETPTFVDERLVPHLANAIFDWQIANGVLLKHRDGGSIKAKPVNVSLLPTLFPKQMFEHAQKLQRAYNELYAKVSSDEEWLLGVLKNTAREDDFVRALIEVHEKVREEGFAQVSMQVG